MVTASGINVGFSDKVKIPSADVVGNRIMMPALPENMTPKEIAKLRGLMDHEMAHCLFTKDKTGKPIERPGNGMDGIIANALEDGRINRKMGDKFFGSKENLNELYRIYKAEIDTQGDEIPPGVDPEQHKDMQERFTALLRASMEHVMKAPKDTLSEPNQYTEALSPELVNELRKIETLEDVFEAVPKVKKWILKDYKEPPKQDQEGDGDGDSSDGQEGESSQSQSGSGQGSSQGKSKMSSLDDSGDSDSSDSDNQSDSGDSGDSDKPENSDGDSEGGKGDSEGDDSDENDSEDSQGGSEGDSEDSDDDSDSESGQGDSEGNEGDSEETGQGDSDKEKANAGNDPKMEKGHGTPAETEGGMDSDFIDSFADFCNKVEESIKKKQEVKFSQKDMKAKYLVDTSGDTEIHIKDMPTLFKRTYNDPYVKELLEHGKSLFQGLNDKVAAMRGRLILDLQSKGRIWTKDLDTGRLDTRTLHRPFIGDKRIFKNKLKKDKVNTAVTLLVDCSGSMSGRKFDTAIQLAAIMCDALEMANVPCEVLGFTTGSISGTPNFGVRREGVVHIIFKTFDEMASAFRDKWYGAAGVLRNNVDGEAVLWAAKRLIKRTEERKVLFVLSDGRPAGYVDADMGKHLKDSVKKVEKTGIEVLGVGIMTNAPKRYYTNNVVYNGLSELMAGFYKRISDMLRFEIHQNKAKAV